MLSSLEIKNFKGIKSGTISDLAQVNILVGRNNSGKSTILDALLLMRCAFALMGHTGNNGLEQIIKRKIDRGNVNLRELHYMLNNQEQISLGATFADGTRASEFWEVEERRLNLSLGANGSSQEWPHSIVVGPGMSIGNARTQQHTKFMAQTIGAHNAELISTSYQMEPNSIRFPFLETFWEELILDRRDRKLQETVNDIYQMGIEGIDRGKFAGQDRLVAKLPYQAVAVDWLGDGLRYALNILALGMLLQNTILMVEELETHQHPESLKKLTQTLLELAKRQNLQLFLTTHSWELMTYALEAAEEKDVGLTFHHTRLNEQGGFDARPISVPDARLLMDIGHDPRRMYKYMEAK